MTNENGEVCCPMCKSTQIVANKKDGPKAILACKTQNTLWSMILI